MSEAFHFSAGQMPLLVSIPHVGTDIPAAVAKAMTPVAEIKADTDWHVDRLYDFAAALGASTLAARTSRYVIDFNRDPADKPLYAGANNTELCPTSTFDQEPLYPPGGEPDAAEVERRRALYWQPYHDCLAGRAGTAGRAAPRHCVLWEGHSISSHGAALLRGTAARPELRNRRWCQCRARAAAGAAAPC